MIARRLSAEPDLALALIMRVGDHRSDHLAHGIFALIEQKPISSRSRVESSSVALYAFDESLTTFRRRALSRGLAIDAALASELLSLRQIDPGQALPGELACELANEVERHGTRIIVIDTLNGYLQAMPNDPSSNLQVHDLLSCLSACGTLTLVTLAQPSPLNRQEGLPVDLSYLTDTVIAQRYFEAYGAIRYAVSVMKKRYGDHERTIREYKIGQGGVIVGEPLSEFRGVLTGVPEYLGEDEPLL